MSSVDQVPRGSVLVVSDTAAEASPPGGPAPRGFLEVLRKHGWLDVEVAPPAALDDAGRLRGHDLLILSHLDDWQTSWLRSLRAFDGVLFIEGPVPPLVESFVGVRSVPGEPAVHWGQLRMRRWLRSSLAAAGCELAGDRFPLGPAAWPLLCDARGDLRPDVLARLAAAYADVYAHRLEVEGVAFADNPVNDGLALMALALYGETLPPGSRRERVADVVKRVLLARAGGSAATDPAPADGGWTLFHDVAARLARVEVEGRSRDPGGGDQVEDLEAGALPTGDELPAGRVQVAAGRAYLAALRGDVATATQWLQTPAIDGVEPRGTDAMGLWLFAAACRRTGGGRAALPWLAGIAGEIEATEGRLPSALSGWRLTEIIPLAGALEFAGHASAAARLMRAAVVASFDPRSGRLLQGQVQEGWITPGGTRTLAPAVLLGLLAALGSGASGGPSLDARATPSGTEPPREPPLRIPSYLGTGAEDELALERSEGTRVGVARRGRVLFSSFPLLSHLAQVDAASGWAGDERSRGAGDGDALTHSFFALLEDQLIRYGRETLVVSAPPADVPRVRVQRVSDEQSHCTYEVTGQPAGDLLLRFVCPRELVAGATLDGRDVELADAEPPSEGVVVRLRPDGPPARRLQLLRRRPARFAELAGAIAASGDRAAVEYAAEELLPRLSNLTELLAHFTGATDITELSVGDVGCGYGPFPLTMHLVERPRQLVGIDLSAESVAAGQALVERLDAEGITFTEGDVRVLGGIRQLDLLLCLNVLYYLTTRRARRDAASAAFRAVRPGGAAVALLTNRRHRVDEFTGLRWVHRMPRRLAHLYVRRRKVAEGYLHVRSPTPLEVSRTYRRAGFHVELIDPDQMKPITRARRYRKARFYLVAAKPPP